MNKRKNKSVKKVTKVIRNLGEKKIVDTANNAVVSSAFVTIPMLPIQQGTGYNERVGFGIAPKSFEIRLQFNAGTAVLGTTVANIRIILYRDMQQIDSSTPVGTDVLSTADPVAQLNFFNKYRFKIMLDTNVKVDIYHPQVMFKKVVKANFQSRFSGAGLTAINKNGVYLLMVSDNTVNPPTVKWWNRVVFTDL